MKSIQGILIACFLMAAILASIAFRARLIYRLLAVVLFLAAAVFIFVPDLTTVIARSLGVGRGTDLLLYLSLIAGIHIALLLYRRTRELERKMAELVRAAAIRDAQMNPLS
ncbi:MAG TPA: DUF2304 domain-containing protein [Bryobacteraceae bacterium]|nr:DUF2304 domain-containing protein [Bryobacteraceae bacterium]